jgi:hypothetical protein
MSKSIREKLGEAARNHAIQVSGADLDILARAVEQSGKADPRGPFFSTQWEREDYEREQRGEPARGPSVSRPATVVQSVCSLCLGTGKVFHENPPRKDTPWSRCHCGASPVSRPNHLTPEK